jgi:hypothetical protein
VHSGCGSTKDSGLVKCRDLACSHDVEGEQERSRQELGLRIHLIVYVVAQASLTFGIEIYQLESEAVQS